MWRVGDQCYFLETYTVVPGVITRITGDFVWSSMAMAGDTSAIIQAVQDSG